MKRLIVNFLLFFTIFSQFLSATKVLYVTHEPGKYHTYTPQLQAFKQLAKSQHWDLKIITGDYRAVVNKLANKPNFAKGVDLVVYNFCLAHEKKIEAAYNIIETTRTKGIPALAIHCAHHSFWATYKYNDKITQITPKGAHPKVRADKSLVDAWVAKQGKSSDFPIWSDFAGIASTGHGSKQPINCHILNRNHPFTKGLSDYTTIPTELYNNVIVSNRVIPIIEGKQGDKSALVLWENPLGKSRVIGLTLGHYNEEWKSKNFQKILVNIVETLSGKTKKQIASLQRPLRSVKPLKLEPLVQSVYTNADITPSPACLSANLNGDLFVGIDLAGSLGKGAGKGKIIKLVDQNRDGKVDKHTVFAKIDNPRGLFSIGDKLYVLHAVVSPSTHILEAMHLSVLEDKDQDGKADSSPQFLVKNISSPKLNQKRGVDHATNGIRMGIDGWIYVAVGDFGFVKAKGSDGTSLDLLGGGILRVRPDGSKIEMYTRGMRNIYDMAIDPFMNIFTRGNNNDGVGWWVRFTHHVQSAHYGYPYLYKNFVYEMLPAINDIGAGSGTGALYLEDPQWELSGYNHSPLTLDWGLSKLAVHHLVTDEASFKASENSLGLHQPTDIDIDGLGQLYVSLWKGAGYRGNAQKGQVVRLVPKGWKELAIPNLKSLTIAELIEHFKSSSAKLRLHVQQELLSRKLTRKSLLVMSKLVVDRHNSLATRIAAMYTVSQNLGKQAPGILAQYARQPELREFAIRGMGDWKNSWNNDYENIVLEGLKDENPRVRVASAIALGRSGEKKYAGALLESVGISDTEVLADWKKIDPEVAKKIESKPNGNRVFPHVVVKALVALKATDACVQAVNSPNINVAVMALRQLHDEGVVNQLIQKYKNTERVRIKKKLLVVLSRLYRKEAFYDGSWWWATKPNPRGPYYVPVTWKASPQIKSLFNAEYEGADGNNKAKITILANRNRMSIPGIGLQENPAENNNQEVDPKKTLIGSVSIEDAIINLTKLSGNARRGKKVIASSGCISCHSYEKGEKPKGVDLSRIGGKLSSEKIAMAILRPAASIAKGWSEVTLKNGNIRVGMVIKSTKKNLEIRDIAGATTTLPTNKIKSVVPGSTIMFPALVETLEMQQFVDLVKYLSTSK